MSQSERVDPERLAALLEGRLSESEAAVVRRQLASADDATLGAYADAVAVSRQLSEEAAATEAPPRVLPMHRRWRTAPWAFASTVAAAAIVSVVVWRTAHGVYEPGKFARALPPGVGAADGPVWSGVRGSQNDLTDRVRAARAGSLLTDLEVDLSRSQSPRDHALALAALLDGAVGGAAVAAPLRSAVLDSGSQLSAERLEQLGRSATALLDPKFSAAGAYLEAARLATASGDASFFDRASPAALAGLRGEQPLDSAARPLLVRLDHLLEQRPRDPRALNATATELLVAITQ